MTVHPLFTQFTWKVDHRVGPHLKECLQDRQSLHECSTDGEVRILQCTICKTVYLVPERRKGDRRLTHGRRETDTPRQGPWDRD